MANETEVALIQKMLAGDASAFDRLMEPLESGLRSFLRGQLRSRPDLDVEEVLQEVRIYLFRRLDRYNPEYPLPVFARGLARNIVKRFVYKRPDLAPSSVGDDEEDGWQDLTPGDLEKAPTKLRRVLGEGRFEDPEGRPPPSRLFLEMIEIFLRYGGYPHQQAAFGYSILLWGKAKQERSSATHVVLSGKVPVTGDPDRVVKEVGPRELFGSCDELIQGIGKEANVDAGYLDRVRGPLDARLTMSVTDLFARDRTSLKQFERLGSGITGKTALQAFFGKDERKSIADWTRGVKERMKKVFQDPEARKRIPLPDVGTPREP